MIGGGTAAFFIAFVGAISGLGGLPTLGVGLAGTLV